MVKRFRLEAFLIGAILLAILIACALGSAPLGLKQILLALVGQGAAPDQVVVWEIRLPRAMAALLVGMALGASGVVLQTLLQNPLSEPGVLGISSTASLVAVTTLYYGLAAQSGYLLALASIAGALLATFVMLWVGRRAQSVITIILVGVGLSSFAGGLMALLMSLAPHPFVLADMVNWTLGSVAHTSLLDIAIALPFMLIGWLLLLANRQSLPALNLGEEGALAVGLNLASLQHRVILGVGLLSGAAVATAGTLGFIGVVAPHIIRPFVHYDPARTLIPAALLGGLLVLSADILIRLLPTESELKLGVVAALFGAPVFVYIIWKRPWQHD